MYRLYCAPASWPNVPHVASGRACVGTLVEASNAADGIHVAARVSDGVASCEMRQDAYRLSADQFSRLTDLEWSEQAHGGGLDARRTESGGCVLVLTIRA